MFIQTEATPNPATLKFLPGRTVLPAGTLQFDDAASAGRSPLAQRLFGIDGVAAVFIGYDFVTITKSDGADWSGLKTEVMGALLEHFTLGAPVLEGGEVADDEFFDPADGEIVGQIKELIETRVRPAVANDGGDITFKGFDKGVVYLNLRGACAGCPSSTATLKMGIENMLKHYVPEVLEVRASA
jgi:Fe-S cluster biogenesis protein NfuA